MLAKDFIYEKLQSLAKRFSSIEIKYAFNSLAHTHIVELDPQEAYYYDPGLENAWIEIVKEFMQSYPIEDISFISSDSTLAIISPEFEFNASSRTYVDIPSNFKWPGLENIWTSYFNAVAAKIPFEDITLPYALESWMSLEEPTKWDFLNHFQFTHAQIVVKNILHYPTADDQGHVIKPMQDGILPGDIGYAMAA